MRFAFIEATDLGDAWFQALYKIMMEGRKYLITKGSRQGLYRIGIAITIVIKNPSSRPLFPLMPEGQNIPAPTDEETINKYLEYLLSPERQPDEHYTYGEDISWLHEWIINHYKKYGHGNNHGYMTVGRPETVYFYDRDIGCEETITIFNPETKEIIRQRHISNEWNKDPEIDTSSQCLRGIDTWIEDNKLNFWVYFRSWDLWNGFPTNLGGIQLVKKHMADEIGIEDGEMIVSCKDLHVYEDAWSIALMRIKKDEKILEGR